MKLISAALITVAITAASSNAAASFCPSGKKSKQHAYYYYPQHHGHYRERHAYYPGYRKPYRHAYMPAFKQPAGRKAAPVQSPKSKAYETSGNIIDTAIDAGSVSSLIDALKASGLSETLSGTGSFTVFAPSDKAFAKIPEPIRSALIADKEALKELLTYHVISGEVTAADIKRLTSAETVQGSSISIDTSNGIKVDGANVVAADIRASNGIIHIIDTVMIPN